MGNSLAIDRDPPTLTDIMAPTHVHEFGEGKDLKYSQYLFMWAFDYDKTIGYVISTPIHILQISRLNPFQSYVILYLYKKDSVPLSGENAGFPKNLVSLIEGLEEIVSPRGLMSHFSTTK